MTALTTQARVALPADLQALVDGFAAQAAAANTAKGYSSDLRHFAAWCGQHGFTALPATAEVAAGYLAAHAALLAPATLERRLASISAAHRQAGHEFDTGAGVIRGVFSGIKRSVGTKQERVAAATCDVVRAMALTCDDSLTGLRDRALLLLGFALAGRRSELVAIEVSDLRFVPAGMIVTIRKGKGDQEGQGTELPVKSPAVIAAVQAWLKAAGITEGTVLRSVGRYNDVRGGLSDQSVALVVKKRAEMAGLDGGQFSGHSLRAGFVTSAHERGASEAEIMAVSRHKSVEVMRGYIRRADLFNNAAADLGI